MSYFDLKRKRFLLSNLQLFNEGTNGNDGDDSNNTPSVDTVPKAMFDKVSAELSDVKKQLKTKQSDAEIALEAQKEKDAELEELRNYKQRSSLENSLLTNGIAKEEAKKIVDSILSGDMEKIGKAVGDMYTKGTANLQQQIDELKLSTVEKPSGSNDSGDKGVTLDEFNKMTIDEKIALKNSNPELFNQLTKQK